MNIMQSTGMTSYNVKLIDTGDNYIIGFEHNHTLTQKYILPTLCELYKKLDIDVNISNIANDISFDTKEFIKTVCGSVIPTSLPFCGKSNRNLCNDETIAHKLTKDIYNIIDFHRIKRFWSAYNSSHSSTCNTVDLKSTLLSDIETSKLRYDNLGSESSQQSYEDVFEQNILPRDFCKLQPRKADEPKSSREISKFHYVIYNKTYLLTILYYDNIGVMDEIVKEFGEWDMIARFRELDENMMLICKQMFERKTFESAKVAWERASSFISLFGLQEDHQRPKLGADGTSTFDNEKHRVTEYMKDNFKITDDPNKRIKASELYKQLVNAFKIGYDAETQFKKRLTGYLLEMGVSKKRYADGFYFFGLTQS